MYVVRNYRPSYHTQSPHEEDCYNLAVQTLLHCSVLAMQRSDWLNATQSTNHSAGLIR